MGDRIRVSKSISKTTSTPIQRTWPKLKTRPFPSQSETATGGWGATADSLQLQAEPAAYAHLNSFPGMNFYGAPPAPIQRQEEEPEEIPEEAIQAKCSECEAEGEQSASVPIQRMAEDSEELSEDDASLQPKERLGIQTKLTIGQPNDKYEREADGVAEQVMRMPEPNPWIQAKANTGLGQPSNQRLCPEYEEDLQRQPQENYHSETRVNRKEYVDETVSKLTEEKKKPQDLEPETAESIGRESLQVFGYERIMKMAVEAGLIEERGKNQSENFQKQSQHSETRIFRQAELAPSFWRVFAPYATTAGVTSQVDTPAPGPADAVAIGILVVGLAVAGYTVLMASSGNQADTEIMGEAQELIGSGRAATLCAALELLMQLAKQAGNKARIQRIKKTQKAKGCRHSRHS